MRHLRAVHDESDGTDGFASIEVEPAWADDTEGDRAPCARAVGRVGRPNVFIKIPATEAGIPAVEQAIADGINVNVTLMFSVEVYERIAARLHRRAAATRTPRAPTCARQASVASFFVSRVDTKIDKRLDELGTREALEARGQGGHREREARLPVATMRSSPATSSPTCAPPGRRCSAACGPAPARRTRPTATCCTSRS